MAHEQVGIVWSHFCAHGCAANLMVDLAVESEVVESKNEPE